MADVQPRAPGARAVLAAVMMCALLSGQVSVPQAASRSLGVVIVKGDEANNDVSKGLAAGITIRVTGEGSPVGNVNVTIVFPPEGPTLRTGDGKPYAVVTTDSSGTANFDDLRTNNLTGDVDITVLAKAGDRTGRAHLIQHNVNSNGKSAASKKQSAKKRAADGKSKAPQPINIPGLVPPVGKSTDDVPAHPTATSGVEAPEMAARSDPAPGDLTGDWKSSPSAGSIEITLKIADDGTKVTGVMVVNEALRGAFSGPKSDYAAKGSITFRLPGDGGEVEIANATASSLAFTWRRGNNPAPVFEGPLTRERSKGPGPR